MIPDQPDQECRRMVDDVDMSSLRLGLGFQLSRHLLSERADVQLTVEAEQSRTPGMISVNLDGYRMQIAHLGTLL